MAKYCGQKLFVALHRPRLGQGGIRPGAGRLTHLRSPLLVLRKIQKRLEHGPRFVWGHHEAAAARFDLPRRLARLSDGGDDGPAGGEVGGQLRGQRHIADAAALVYKQHVGGGEHVGEGTSRLDREKAQVGQAMTSRQLLQMRPLVPIAQQHEEQPLVSLGRQSRARHHVLKALLVAHVAGVEAEDSILRQAEPLAYHRPFLRGVRHRLRDVRPVPHPLDAA